MTSKKARSMTTATPCAIAARTDPNFLQHILRMGPIQQAMQKRPPKHARIDGDRSESNCSDTDECVGGLGVLDPRLCVDEEVWDESHGNQEQRTDDFADEDIGKMSSRHITRQLGRRLSECLLLVPNNACS